MRDLTSCQVQEFYTSLAISEPLPQIDVNNGLYIMKNKFTKQFYWKIIFIFISILIVILKFY